MMTNEESVREALAQLEYHEAYTDGEQWAVDMVNGLKRVLEQMRPD